MKQEGTSADRWKDHVGLLEPTRHGQDGADLHMLEIKEPSGGWKFQCKVRCRGWHESDETHLLADCKGNRRLGRTHGERPLRKVNTHTNDTTCVQQLFKGLHTVSEGSNEALHTDVVQQADEAGQQRLACG
jgi:hypothetical protein